MSDVLLSIAEVATRTSTSQSFWRKQLARRVIPVVRVGRCVRIRQSDLDAWLRLRLRPTRREG